MNFLSGLSADELYELLNCSDEEFDELRKVLIQALDQLDEKRKRFQRV